MAHCKPTDIQDLTELLTGLRGIVRLKEKSPGCFYLKGKGILHFHIQKGRRFAHVSNGVNWSELDIVPDPSIREQRAILSKISKLLPA